MKFLTIDEFLKRFPMGRSTLYRLVAKGLLPITKFGRSSRIAESDAISWAETLPKFNGKQ